MHLAYLKLGNFKNYESQRFDFSEKLNCLTGLNGMGKTNVLDAVHLLCLCKSQSGLNDKQLIRHGESFYRAEGQFVSGKEKTKIVAKFQGGQTKQFETNGKPLERLSDHIGRIPLVAITPDDVTLVQEGSEERRRFMDQSLSQISSEYLQNLLIYNALLKQRNALLKTFAEQRRFDEVLLESIDRQMKTPAELLHGSRSRFVVDFKPYFSEYYAQISGGNETVDLSYRSDLESGALDVLLAENLEKDRLLQRTTSGTHRDDLLLFMDGLPLKKFASQGQLKSYLLALRLAQYDALRKEKGVAPILLLDDIFDKLDEHRVRSLVALLLKRDFGQVFITDTQRSRIEQVVSSFTGNFKLFEIENGAVKT
ncbi:MAG: DNA replication/repair protein RecF [Saprospiraceae bacterium]|nr:DNA replication/repair protein RecF [Saprospiraceae bacterium]